MEVPGAGGEYHEAPQHFNSWGVGVKLENLSMGGMDIFWNHTMINLHAL